MHDDLHGVPEGPAFGLANSPGCKVDQWHSSHSNDSQCEFQGYKLQARALQVIREHNASEPLFLYLAPHAAHTPLEVPRAYYDRLDRVGDEGRRRYLALMAFVDDFIGNVTSALKARGMWEHTLMLGSSDNGGAIYNEPVGLHFTWPDGTLVYAGASNFPKRGGKLGLWQGGIVGVAWAAGGLVPASMRGQELRGMSSAFDFFATACSVAGVDPTDHRAKAAGLPPVDSLDLWPWISGERPESPRSVFVIGSWESSPPGGGGGASRGVARGIVAGNLTGVVGGVPDTTWKLVTGTLYQDCVPGPVFPNASSTVIPTDLARQCGSRGCLFDLEADPGEETDVGKQYPAVKTQL